MRVRTHLISMPWSQPEAPSAQLGALKAHLDRALRRPDCRAYSAFFSILHALGGRAFLDVFRSTSVHGEYCYQALYMRRFGPPALRGARATARLLRGLREPNLEPLTRATLDRLERVTRRVLDQEVGPALLRQGVNLIGFSLNYDQVYASLYAAEHLRRRFPDRRLVFVYGGCSIALPNVFRLVGELGVDGLVVIGEGEQKLEKLVRALEALPAGAPDPTAAVADLDPGIVRLGTPVDLGPRDPARYAGQLERLDDLPLPDYDEYFATLRKACADEQTFTAFRANTVLFLEGSRGCFGGCDFCAQNRSWSGFRKRAPERILADAAALTRRYHSARLQFTDNVCDTWAEAYAREVVRLGVRHRSFMDLRAHHPERLWTLVALAGVEAVEVGVEAISTPYLRAMGKGTTAVQNLLAQKTLTELDVLPGNNLMTHHPVSTLADVRETRRILRQIPHWRPFYLTQFRLMAGSPLYEGLTPDQRACLRPALFARVPREAARWACEFTYRLPRSLHPQPGVLRAWGEFRRQYERTVERNLADRPRLDVIKIAPDTLRITDSRGGGMRVLDLCGDDARIYDACHGGPTAEALARDTGLPAEKVGARLQGLIRAGLVLRVDDSYLALALRPRDELLRRFLAAEAERQASPAASGPARSLAVVP